MNFFRSEKMSHCQLLLHSESAFQCLVAMGYQGHIHFIEDPDNILQYTSRFQGELKRCENLQMSIKHLMTEIDLLELHVILYPDVDNDDPVLIGDLNKLELTLESVMTELSDVERHLEGMRSRQNHLVERLAVISRASEFLTGDRYTQAVMAWTDSTIMKLLHGDAEKKAKMEEIRLAFFAGSIPAERFPAFEIMLWRVCSRNYYLKFNDIPDPIIDPVYPQFTIRKYAFVVFFLGEEMGARISKICNGFQVNLYKCPDALHERLDICRRTATALDEVRKVLAITEEHRHSILNVAAADIFLWQAKLKKIKMVFAQLSKMKSVKEVNSEKYMYADCWIPTAKVKLVHKTLRRTMKKGELTSRAYVFPPILIVKSINRTDGPTHFGLNKFTKGFQALVDAYGIASYREINPAPYAIITFPFLFGVMFGDIGHGLIMAAFGYFLVSNEKKFEYEKRLQRKPNEIFNLIFNGRYVVLLMGIFSIYCGFIYNDFFSKAINIFGSSWRVNYNQNTINTNKYLQLDPALEENYEGSPYIFGLDPIWKASGENAIIMSNSMKMKMAIVLGVAQMLFGLVLGMRNCSYFERFIDLYLVVIPQIVFFVCLFGYLVFLIFYKWMTFGGLNPSPNNSACAPSLLMTFIDMVLFRPVAHPPLGCSLDENYGGQAMIQFVLVVVALLTIPIMLVGKPLHFIQLRNKIQSIKDAQQKKAAQRNTLEEVRKSLLYNIDYSESVSHPRQKEHDLEEDVGELWLHQGIHCIECVLGSISHTASYLRLWALSLAHDQLSHVLWKLIFSKGFTGGSHWYTGIFIWALFGAWAVLTVSILVVMEGLSAFLHTLRLHWVEFQSKFYAGLGDSFTPFQFGLTIPYEF